MNIYISTCNKYRHLLFNQAVLLNKFWDRNKKVKIFGKLPPEEELPKNFEFVSMGEEDEEWSNQFIKILNQIPDTHFILLRDDFYFLEPVKKDILEDLEDYVEAHPNISRVGLQTLDEGYTDAVIPYDTTKNGFQLYYLEQDHPYLCSFEASIFKKKFLEKYIVSGEDSRTAEINMSARAKDKAEIVLLTKERVLTYRDAMIGGEERIKFIDNSFYLLTPDGWQRQNITI